VRSAAGLAAAHLPTKAGAVDPNPAAKLAPRHWIDHHLVGAGELIA